MTVRTVINPECFLGEGPLWHQDKLFWFDIRRFKLHACDAEGGGHQSWDLGEHVSAAAPLDSGELLVASESKLFRFDPKTGASIDVMPLEADNLATRSNDGRADRRGGFWIGTMGLDHGIGAGTIYRFRKGELRVLYENITVPNAMCFSPDGSVAYVADSRERLIKRQPVDAEGWPAGDPEPFFKLDHPSAVPDGAIVDSEGHLWCALYRGSAVIRISPQGQEVGRVVLPVPQATCPAFGGPDLKTIFVTSARQNMEQEALDAAPLSGSILAFDIDVPGLPDPTISLD
ncbi:MAG: SMP-30/gluconolactonase/LRE family protein [Pseudomonadota bacterium]